MSYAIKTINRNAVVKNHQSKVKIYDGEKKDITKNVIDELVKRTENNKSKNSDKKYSRFEKNAPKDNFVYKVKNMEAKLKNTDYYIQGEYPLDEESKVKKLKQELIDKRFEKIEIVKQKRTYLIKREYLFQEREIQLQRCEMQKKFNHIIYEFLCKTMPNPKIAEHLNKIDDKLVNEVFQKLNKLDCSVFQNYEFDNETLHQRLTRGIRKRDKKCFNNLNDFFFELCKGNINESDLAVQLLKVHNSFMLESSKSYQARVNKYRSRDNSSKQKVLTKRLTYTDYFNYYVNNDIKKLKYNALEYLAEMLKEGTHTEIIEKGLSNYHLEDLCKDVENNFLNNMNSKLDLDSLIILIKNHYTTRVHTDKDLKDVDKYILSTTHRYVKGRFNKLKKLSKELEEDKFKRELINAFEAKKLKEKIISKIQNTVHNFIFLNGRYTMIFEDTNYDSDNLIKQNKIEAFFKSVNNITTFVQITSTNRMGMINEKMAKDYIGVSSNYNSLENYLNNDNFHQWFDLISYQSFDKSISEKVKELVASFEIIKKVRHRVAHYNYDIKELFKVTDEVTDEISELSLEYQVSFLEKILSNNLLKYYGLEEIKPYLKQGYILQKHSHYLPRGYKIYHELLHSLNSISDEHKQAQNYLLHNIYYHDFSNYFEESFEYLVKKYNNSYKSNLISSTTVRDAYENIQRLIDKGLIKHSTWNHFVKNSFEIYYGEKKLEELLSMDVPVPRKDISVKKDLKTLYSEVKDLQAYVFNDIKNVIFITRAARFLRKKELSKFKHQISKVKSVITDEIEKNILEDNELMIDLLLRSNKFDLKHKYLLTKLDEDNLIAILYKDYSSFENENDYIEVEEFEKQLKKEIITYVDIFSDKTLEINEKNCQGQEVKKLLYMDGKNQAIVNKHLLESYQIGLISIGANCLKNVIKNSGNEFEEYFDRYQKLRREKLENEEDFCKQHQEFFREYREFRKNKNNKNKSYKLTKEVEDSWNKYNEYVFLDNYFKGQYLTQYSDFIIEVWARYTARYYMLEKSYLFTSIFTNGKIKEKNQNDIFKLPSSIACNMKFNYKSDKINKSSRKNFAHANIFQENYSGNEKSLKDIIHKSKDDFNFSKALEKNHKFSKKAILDNFGLDIDFNLKKHNEFSRLSFRHEKHVELIKAIYNHDLLITNN